MKVKPKILSRKLAAQTRIFQVEELDLEFSNGNRRRFERILRDAAPANYALTLQTNRMVSAAQLFASLTLISVITVGAIMAINGILSIGAVAACSLISNRIAQPVLRIIGVWGQLETAKLALERSKRL